MGSLKGLIPENVFRFFEEFSAVPRGSHREAAAADYVESFAEKRGLPVYRDSADNVIIYKEASEGYGDSETVILQGHMDMVCEKDPGCSHDFEKEGLELACDGDYVYANGTTLGGDDGIAVAMMLAVLDDGNLCHPPLECVFTTCEEVGLLGAAALDASRLKGRRLINIDSEEEGIFTVGCAGGMESVCTLPVSFREAFGIRCLVAVDGLLGGHSGTEIDKGRANANILMGRLLKAASSDVPFGISGLYGGNTDNAIAGSCIARLCVDGDEYGALEESVKRSGAAFAAEYAAVEKDLKVTVTNEGPCQAEVLTEESAGRLIELLCSVPDGVVSYSQDMEGLVETSLNLGILKTGGDAAELVFCVRSSVDSQKAELGKKLKALTEAAGGTYVEKGSYPGWKYMKDSALRDTMIRVYEKMYGRSPEVVAIHAGLECGLFCEKLKGLECVSIGPDLLDIHTPKEKLSVSSAKRVYEFLTEALGALK